MTEPTPTSIPKRETPVFSRKYKPYYLDDFYIPDGLKQTIRSLMELNETNLLILGEPNTGKTSLIYALVRHYYGLSKNDSFPENEVIFINNLKEQQGVSFFRNELKSFCQSRSQHHIVQGKKKMVVIDDLDLINPQCQQVMCNYMDKYGGTVLFVYSCLNIQKIVEGIQSRVMVLEIEPPKRAHLENLFFRILEEENKTKGGQQVLFLQEELESIRDFLIENSNGNPLSLVNCMEKCVVFQGRDGPPISLEMCRVLFLTRIFQSFQTYLGLLQQGDLLGSIQVMYSILQNGYSVVDIFDYFFQYIKTCMELEETYKYEIVKWLCHYITIVRNVHEENLELVLFTNRLFSIVNREPTVPL